MKPGKNDRKYSIRITGAELAALKECCLDLPESFGLDRRIDAYQGARAIGFYRWDLDCLVDVLTLELKTSTAGRYPSRQRRQPDREALQSIFERFTALRDQAYQELDELLGG